MGEKYHQAGRPALGRPSHVFYVEYFSSKGDLTVLTVYGVLKEKKKKKVDNLGR